MTMYETLSVRPGVSLSEMKAGGCVITGPVFAFTLNRLPSGVQRAVAGLFAGGSTEQQLLDLASETDGVVALPHFSYLLKRLDGEGLVCRTICDGGRSLVTLVPTLAKGAAPVFQESARYVLSRFTLMRREDGRAILESPLGVAKAVLHDRRASVLAAALTEPVDCRALLTIVPDLSEAAATALLHALHAADLLSIVGPGGAAAEDTDTRLLPWQFHDLLLHSRSRFGRHEGGYGGTYKLVGTVDPLPAIKERMTDDVVALPRPDLADIEPGDPPLLAVMEARKSISDQGSAAITLPQLSEFLYRVARVRAIWQTGQEEVSSRPYPNGGACYELEIYPCVDRCAGLDPGLYQYRPLEHELCRLSGANPHTDRLLEFARIATLASRRPQILLVLTARFPRVMVKYESVAYALILKHVGVLYQSMYLVATAMGLAPRAIGGGDSDLFGRAAGLDSLSEGAVGEFVLGSLPGSA